MATEIKEIEEALKGDPTDPRFTILIKNYTQKGRYVDALLVALGGLSYCPDNYLARVLLARIFFELGFVPFALRELQVLRECVQDASTLDKLIDKISPIIKNSKEVQIEDEEERTIADQEFEVEELELLLDEEE